MKICCGWATWKLHARSHEVSRAGHPIDLTAREFEVLLLFMRNPRAVLSKAQILDRVWDYDFGGNGNIVELYVSYLRKKIDAPFEDLPNLFHTKRGAGLHPSGRSVKAIPPVRRWRLQTRLIVLASLVLILVGAGIGAASWWSVRTSLMSDLDSQLAGMTHHARVDPGPGQKPGEPSSLG